MSTKVNEDGQLVIEMEMPDGVGVLMDHVVVSRAASAEAAIQILARQDKLRCRCGAMFHVVGDQRARCSSADPTKEHGL